MNISQSGLNRLKGFEGLRLEAYQCSANVWTIGYGTTRVHSGPVQQGMRITEDEAERLLKSDVRYFEQRVNDLVQVPLNQNQFDALVSLVYNIGEGAFASSTLLRELNAGNYQEAGEQFLRWNRADGKVNTGLVSRRTQERNLFMQVAGTPPQGSPPPPAAVPPAPLPERPSMPLPVAAVAALGLELLKLLPFAKKPENAKAVEQIGPQLVAIAKEVAGPAAVNEQAAVETVQKNPQAQSAFVAKAVEKWSDIAPMLEFEEKSRQAAREFNERWDGDRLIFGQLRFVELLSLIFVIIAASGAYLVLTNPTFPAELKGAVVTLILIGGWTAVQQFWLGSSRGSQVKDATISEQARR